MFYSKGAHNDLLFLFLTKEDRLITFVLMIIHQNRRDMDYINFGSGAETQTELALLHACQHEKRAQIQNVLVTPSFLLCAGQPADH